MNKNPILSILIPTKNREKFAFNVIQNILGISSDNFQLVIQNNSDTNELDNLLSEFKNDSRLSYNYDGAILSFVDNFSLGISKCEGEYVTIIGDDDTVNPFIINIAEWAYKNCIDAITPSLPIVYFWPESGVSFANNRGMLTIESFSCNMSFVKTKNEIKKFLQNGCHNYLDFHLAKAYHGLVKKAVLEKIKTKTGTYIGGLSPDIYLSIAISLLIEKVLILDYPLTISGICKQSGSSDSATGKHTGELKDAPHFKGHDNYKWSKKIPQFYSVETIWGDSALAAITELEFKKYLKYFRDNILSVYCLRSHPEFKSVILTNLKNNNNCDNNILLYLRLSMGYILVDIKSCIYLKNRILNKLRRYRNKIFLDVPDIKSASEICNNVIKVSTDLMMKKIN